ELRCSLGRSRADPTISLRLCQFWSIARPTSFDLSRQPGFCDIPFALYRGSRNTQYLSYLLIGETAEETQFDDPALLWIKFGQATKRVVQGDDVQTAFRRSNHRPIKFYLEICTSFCGPMTAGMIDQNLAHQARCHCQEVHAILTVERILVEEAKICLMNKGCTVQRMVRSLPLQVMPGDLPQFAVEQRHESIERLLVTRLPLRQEVTS